MVLLKIILLAFGFLLTYAVFLIGYERKIVYYPHKFPSGNWEVKSSGIRVEDIDFKSQDGVSLHGWYIPTEGAQATLLWFHGNAGNITHRLENIQLLKPLKLNIFIFDYRGYGRSEGEPEEGGLYKDSLAAYDFLIREKKVTEENLFLFGRSLGGICAVEVASQRFAAGLILESTFTSAQDMVKKIFPLLPLGRFIKSRFNAVETIASVHIPKLFLHGMKDEVVPYRLGRKLYASAPQPKQFYDIPNAGHNDTYIRGGLPYFDELLLFITETLVSQSQGEGQILENKSPH